MAKKAQRKNGKKAGWIAFGVTLLLYALIFPFNKLLHYVIGGGVAALVGCIVKTMATPLQGLDKNAKAKDDLNVVVIEDEYARGIVESGVQMLDALKTERDAISEYVFTRRLDALRANYDQLLRAVIEDPDKAVRIRKFNTYYFPTAVKMLQAYRQKKGKGTSYMAMSATREDILQMLDDLTEATQKLLDTMLQADLEDMDIEMDVFARMLKSDGLTEDELVNGMRDAAHEAAKDIPMSKAPTVQPTRTAQAPASAPVQAKPVQAEPAEVSTEEPAQEPRPVLEHEAEAAQKASTPVPVLDVPVTATAAQLHQGAPVLNIPTPDAPDFGNEVRKDHLTH